MVNSRIKLCERSHCDVAIAVLRETDSSNVLNKIANRAYKARTDQFNHLHSLWESAGYKVESKNDQLHQTWNLIWASLGTVIIAEQETIKLMRTRASEVITKWNLAEFTSEWWLVESDYEHNPRTRFLTRVWPGIEPRYGTNYAVSLPSVKWVRETLVVRE